MELILKRRNVLPGFPLAMGFTLFYLSLIVLIPLSTLFFKTATMSWQEFYAAVASPRVVASYYLSFSAAFLSALVNSVFGLLIAWVLVRYQFPGKKLVDVIVDLPFALPTAVAGIALTAAYSDNGPFGGILQSFGIKAVFSPLGVVIAMTFVSLPFVVRTVQPILQDLDADMEEAAACLGANRFKTFLLVIFPNVLPALATGFALAFARALGEYGSVVFISGNLPMQTEITPLLIISKLEQFDYAGATAIASTMPVTSFVLQLVINLLQYWLHRRHKGDQKGAL